MSIAQIGQQHCPCTHTMKRHNRMNNTDGETKNPPSVNEQDQQPPQRVGFAGHLSNNMVQEMDTEGDNALSFGETELSQETFDAIDGDADGVLTGKEIANGMRDNRENLGLALGLERPEEGEAPENTEHRPHRGRRRRQALAAYEGSMSNLMTAVFEPTSTAGAETATITDTETVDVAV